MLSSRTAPQDTVSEGKSNIRKMELYVKKTKFPHSVIRNQIRRFLSFLSKMNLQLNNEQKEMRRAPRDFTEGEDKDFTQEWYIREES